MTKSYTHRVALAAVFVAMSTTNAFVNIPPSQPFQTSTTTSINGFMDAFKNDDSLGAAQNAGLSGGPRYNDQVTVNGKAGK